MNNVISYIAPKNKTMAHIMSLNNRISYVLVISIFGFKTCWKRLFNLLYIKTTATFKQFVQAEELNANKNKLYYQRYYLKILRAFHQQELIKQNIYENILARQSGIDYSPGMQFQISLINMDKSKEITMNNQPVKSTDTGKRCWCGSLENLLITSKESPIGISYQNAKKRAWG